MFGKPAASLSSGLLARKGHARPAMRPQGFMNMGHAGSEDLGWNDMGEDVARPQPYPAPLDMPAPPAPPVVRQLAELEEQISQPPVTDPIPEEAWHQAPDFGPEYDEEYDETAEYEDEDEAEPEYAPLLATRPVVPPVVAPVAAPLAPVVASIAPVAPPFVPVAPAAPVVAPVSQGTLARVVREVKGGKAKAAFTLRLDNERHLKLRLASALCNRSAQQLVTEALDAFLESIAEVDDLARQVTVREVRQPGV